ncbi:helix-turn-helix domain-containing protein [Mangrovibacterium marinum]|uniref:helix-turn-helix domain-containing protein n=1 Tax=Mangrovibacterium marinum TaxID=1639118 RepID=UPI002A1882BF|nr:helix-turn-helix domain-containing protein [Mangrovibacterium marinum]
MKTEDYSKISIEHFARQMHVNVISESSDFIVSKNPNTLEEHSLDFDHPHIVEGIAIVFCTKGQARIKTNLSTYEVSENSLLIIAPNSIIQVLEQSIDLKIEFLFFMFDFISNIRLTPQLGYIVKLIEEKACLQLTENDFEELLIIHQLIVKQYKVNTVYREEVIKNLLYALIYKILQLYTIVSMSDGDHSKSRKENIHRKFITLLFEHYKTERSVQFYADKLFLTPKYFSKIIKEISGKPVLVWIDEIVVMSAKALLKSTEMTVAQISEELNFANPSFFGTFFKKHVGLTPIQYRRL